VVVTFRQTPLLKGEGYSDGRLVLVLNPRQRAGAFGFRTACCLGRFINW